MLDQRFGCLGVEDSLQIAADGGEKRYYDYCNCDYGKIGAYGVSSAQRVNDNTGLCGQA